MKREVAEQLWPEEPAQRTLHHDLPAYGVVPALPRAEAARTVWTQGTSSSLEGFYGYAVCLVIQRLRRRQRSRRGKALRSGTADFAPLHRPSEEPPSLFSGQRRFAPRGARKLEPWLVFFLLGIVARVVLALLLCLWACSCVALELRAAVVVSKRSVILTLAFCEKLPLLLLLR